MLCKIETSSGAPLCGTLRRYIINASGHCIKPMQVTI
jgi:hypothetical protein